MQANLEHVEGPEKSAGLIRPRYVAPAVLVEYSMFELWDENGLGSGLVLGVTTQDWMRGGRDKVEVACLVHDEYVSLTVEVYDRPPPPLSKDWEQTATASAWLSSGRVRVWTITMGPADEVVYDTGLTGPVNVSAATKGGARALAAFLAAGSGIAADVIGLEHFLLQLWPNALDRSTPPVK